MSGTLDHPHAAVAFRSTTRPTSRLMHLVRHRGATALTVMGVALCAAPLAAPTSSPTGAAVVAAPQIEVHYNLSYPVVGGTQQADLYLPPASARNGHLIPGIVFVHGGGWLRGQRSEMDWVAARAAAYGYAGLVVDYRLHVLGAPGEGHDVEAAISWAAKMAPQFGVDPHRLAALGTSAGAQLVTEASTVSGTPLRAVVGWSGPYDLISVASDPALVPQEAALLRCSLAHAGCRVASTAAPQIFVASYIGCLPIFPACHPAARAQSPVFTAHPGMPATFLVNSTNELVPTSQMDEYAHALQADGVTVQTLLIPGTGHAIAYQADAIAPTLAFLDQVMPAQEVLPPAVPALPLAGPAKAVVTATAVPTAAPTPPTTPAPTVIAAPAPTGFAAQTQTQTQTQTPTDTVFTTPVVPTATTTDPRPTPSIPRVAAAPAPQAVSFDTPVIGSDVFGVSLPASGPTLITVPRTGAAPPNGQFMLGLTLIGLGVGGTLVSRRRSVSAEAISTTHESSKLRIDLRMHLAPMHRPSSGKSVTS